MALWEYYSIDALSRAVRAELPLSAVSITEHLKTPGSFQAEIPLRHAKATPALLDTENTLIACVRDQTLIYVFELLSAVAPPDGDTVKLDGTGMFGALRARHLRSTVGMTYGTADPVTAGVRWTGVDQFRIVADLIDHAQAVTGGDLGITVAWSALSGVTRDRTFPYHGRSIGQLIEDLSNVEGGFDFAVEPTGTVDNFDLTLRLSYPRRGRATGYRFDANSSGSPNLLAWGLAESSRERISRFTALGAGEGKDQLTATAEDPTLLGVLPLREASGSWVDVEIPATLTGHARRELGLNSRASKVPILISNPAAEPALGAWIIGDQVQVTIDDGWIQVDGTYRIVGATIRPGDDGDEEVALTVAELGRFT